MDFNFKYAGTKYHCKFDNDIAVLTPEDFETQDVVDAFIENEIFTEYFVSEEYKTYTLSLLLKGDFPKPDNVPYAEGRVY